MNTFSFKGSDYQYFRHIYNTTWDNERCVEVPIIQTQLKGHGRVLEIGNVLNHYQPVTHTVLDKYEKGEGIINEDLFDFRPTDKFDLIISISTFEHIGFDEPPRELGGPKEAVTYAASLLVPMGRMIYTIPIGYNHLMDAFLRGTSGVSYMKRRSERQWVECKPDEALGAKYGQPFHCANAIAIAELSI